MKDPLIIHHGGCADGVGAAWWLSLHLNGDAEIAPWGYNKPNPTTEQVADRDVFIVDFCFPADALDDILGHCRNLIVLDHHQTAVEFVANAGAQHYDSVEQWQMDRCPPTALIVNQNRSGIGNVLEFCETIGSEHAVPEFLLDLEDRDLWRFDRENTKETFAAITSMPMTVEQFGRWRETEYEDILLGGRAISRYRDQLIDGVAASTFDIFLRDANGHDWGIPCASSPYAIGSDVAGRLAEQSNDGIGAYVILHEQDVQIGLRSRGNGPDVAVIAERYGGGGHTHASGLRLAWPAFIACLGPEVDR